MHTAQIGTTFIFARYYTQLTRFVAQGPRASQGILFIRFGIIWHRLMRLLGMRCPTQAPCHLNLRLQGFYHRG